MKNKFTLKLMLTLLVFGYSLNSQNQNRSYLNHVFATDSLVGFDEVSAKQQAFAGSFFGSEYNAFMYSAKRAFINEKYNFPKPIPFNTYSQLNYKTNTAPCQNEGFEASPTGSFALLSGWNISEGQNTGVNGSCTMAGCCPTPSTSNGWIKTTPFVDGYMGSVANSPLGGSKIIQLNDANPGWSMVRLTQTFPVTASNTLFQYAYMAAFYAAHPCCDAPFLRITLIDCAFNILPCTSNSIVPNNVSCPSAIPGFTTNAGGYSWNLGWQVRGIDLTPYLGSCVTIEVTVGDCTGGAHFGYVYFDAKCSSLSMNVNGTPVTAGTYTACGTPTLTAPLGFSPSWDGPPASGIVSNTNAAVTTTTSGTYSLTLSGGGLCTPITLTVNLTVPICTGINEINSIDNSLVISPNPNNGNFSIESKKDEIVSVINELGQLVQTINLNSQNKFRYSVTNLSSGIYFVISGSDKHKIVVQK